AGIAEKSRTLIWLRLKRLLRLVRHHNGHLGRRGAGVKAEHAFDRQLQDELAADAQLTLDGDVAAVFAEDFSAHRQAEAGAARAFGADEELKDLGELVGRDAGAVVEDD